MTKAFPVSWERPLCYSGLLGVKGGTAFAQFTPLCSKAEKQLQEQAAATTNAHPPANITPRGGNKHCQAPQTQAKQESPFVTPPKGTPPTSQPPRSTSHRSSTAVHFRTNAQEYRKRRKTFPKQECFPAFHGKTVRSPTCAGGRSGILLRAGAHGKASRSSQHSHSRGL